MAEQPVVSKIEKLSDGPRPFDWDRIEQNLRAAAAEAAARHDPEAEARREAAVRVKAESERAAWLEKVDSPDGYAELLRETSTPAAYQIPESIEPHSQAAPFVRGESRWLMFHGPVGLGKTWAATRAFLERARQLWKADRERRIRALWIDTSDALQKARRQWRTPEDGELLDYLAAVPLLLLDDIGAEPSYEYAAADLSYVLRMRFNRQLWTIGTCQDLDAVEARLASRFSAGTVVKLKGRDRRIP